MSESVPEKRGLLGPTESLIPEGDDRPRKVCRDCGFVLYENPRVVVGAVCSWEGKVLLVRRAIEPRVGTWTMPSGYLELGETTRAGALREVREEACATAEIDGLLGVYDVAHINQVHLIFQAHLVTPAHAPGVESLESGLFSWKEIPWDDLAFPSVPWALNLFRAKEDGRGNSSVAFSE